MLPWSPPCAKAPTQPQLHQHQQSQAFSCWAPKLTHKSGVLDRGAEEGQIVAGCGRQPQHAPRTGIPAPGPAPSRR